MGQRAPHPGGAVHAARSRSHESALAGSITVLRCSPPLVMAKTWSVAGVIRPYDKAKHFSVELVGVSDIRELSALLASLERDRQACVIRGEPIKEISEGELVRRLGENFADVPRHAVMIEVDGYETVAYSPRINPVGAIREYIEVQLPPAFHEASFRWQLSNSAGAAHKGDTLNVHIWFWLSTPRTSAELRGWAEQTGVSLDKSVFNPVQVHYTSRPKFEQGIRDPVPLRSGLFLAAWDDVELRIADGRPKLAAIRPPAHRDASAPGDPRADWIIANWPTHGTTPDDAVIMDCPFAENHTTGEPGDTSTVYLRSGTRGFEEGRYKCSHNSCSDRTQLEFDEAVKFPGGPILDPADPLATSKLLFDSVFTLDGHRHLIRSQGEWLRYAHTHYEEWGEEAIRGSAWRFLGEARRLRNGETGRFKPSSQQVSQTVDALRHVANFKLTGEPSWIGGDHAVEAHQILSLSDGLLEVGSRRLIPHTPLLFTRNTLPYAWGAAEGVPEQWLQFLNEVFDGDQEQIATLQEIAGYLLTPDTSLQKIFLLLGPRRSGKGTIGKILEALIGRQNIVSPTLTSLTGEFGLQPLIGKLLALVSDVRISAQLNKQAVIERLLLISGEDSVTVNRKNLDYWIGRLHARFFLMSNELPMLPDSAGALTGRFLILETKRSFYDQEDPKLGDRLREETPLILRWALDGLHRLRSRGRFVQPEGGRARLDELIAINNPISTFVSRFCRLTPESASVDDLFEAWCAWRSGSEQPAGSKDTFSRSLTTNYPGLKRSRPRSLGIQRPSLSGIALNPEGRALCLFDEDL